MKPTCAAAALILLATPAWSQTYEVSWSTVDGGGAMGLTGGVYGIDSTTGQADAGGPFAGGAFTVQGGFWAVIATGATVQTDLSITNSDGQTSAVPGQAVTYTVTARNGGPSNVSGATVLDSAPVALTNVTWTCSATPGSACPASGSGSINVLVDLLTNGDATFHLSGTISPSATGVLVNAASIAPPAGVIDTNVANNAASDSDTLTPQADLSVVPSDSPDPVAPGAVLTYTLQLANTGPSTSTGVTLTDTLPAAVTFVSSTPACAHAAGTLTCALGNLQPAGNATVTVQVTVNADAGGVLTNTASVASGTPDPITSNNSGTVTTQVLLKGQAELVHGSDVRTDLRAANGVAQAHFYRISQKPYSSYEVVLDSTSGDLGSGSGPFVERIAPNAAVIQSSQPVGSGPSRSLRFANSTSVAIDTDLVRVRSASCGSGCGPDDVYRLRTWETTGSIARFNNSSTQITVVILFNSGTAPLSGQIHFWSVSGVLQHSQGFSLGAHAATAVNSSTILALAGQSGSVTISHDGAHGILTGKAVALEPQTGLSFDSVMQLRQR